MRADSLFEGDRLLPVADAREDVRRHVLGMRRVFGDLGIAHRRGEALLRERRVVVEMDQIVGDAGVLGLAREDRFEQRRALQLVGVGLVARRGRDVERDRIGDLRLVIVGIVRRDLLFGRQESLHAGAVIDLVVVDIHRRDRIDVFPLARGAGIQRLAFFRSFKAERKVFRWRRCMRIVEVAERDPPIGDGALWVGLQHLLEGASRRAVPERMLIQHGPIEQLLRFRLAGCYKMDFAQSLFGRIRGGRLRNGRGNEANDHSEGKPCHGTRSVALKAKTVRYHLSRTAGTAGAVLV
ncbi:hypothetical protein ACVWYP_001676 [Bradyrhizobium sp. USDA 3262]